MVIVSKNDGFPLTCCMDKKAAPNKLAVFFKKLGPGLITGASDDDPSGIATYSQAGAQFGLATLWTSLLTFPLMAAIQGMCARIGLVTSQGLTVTLKNHYPRPVLYIMLLFQLSRYYAEHWRRYPGHGRRMQHDFPGSAGVCFLCSDYGCYDVCDHSVSL